jgi:sugar transferase (PEP-CTERM/EpsH1 system associated)
LNNKLNSERKTKEPLLLLVHRIPYPPNKGDKIRSFNLLKYLSKTYDVYLGAFIDDPEDKKHTDKLNDYCIETCLIDINPMKRKLISLTGILSGEALSVPYYYHKQMQQWVNQMVAKNSIKKLFVYSSPMAQYIRSFTDNEMKIIDFVDVDSEKWKQYSEKHSGVMKWVYEREAEKLFHYEKTIAGEFDCSLFVSENEANVFKQLASEVADKIQYYSNGVDTHYFSPEIELENPYTTKQNIVFTGAMDYWANQEAVIWFAEKIFPGIMAEQPDASFYIVGSRPSEKIKQLANNAGIYVTGGVNDIRPYILYASLVTAPLRIARGIQNKVLEAMAMGRPVVATHAAMEGIESSYRLFNDYTSDSESELTKICSRILATGDYSKLGAKGREMVVNHFSWDSHLSSLNQYLEHRIAS